MYVGEEESKAYERYMHVNQSAKTAYSAILKQKFVSGSLSPLSLFLPSRFQITARSQSQPEKLRRRIWCAIFPRQMFPSQPFPFLPGSDQSNMMPVFVPPVLLLFLLGDQEGGEVDGAIPAGGRQLGVRTTGAGGGGLPSLDGRCRVRGALGAAADGPALRVRLVELLDGVAVPLHVAVTRRRRGVDAALTLLEAGGWCFGGVLRHGVVLVPRCYLEVE